MTGSHQTEFTPFDGLNDVFSPSGEIVIERGSTGGVLAPIPEIKPDLDYDYIKVRKNLQDAIDQTQEALEGILSLATSSDSPRAYEVVAQLLATKLEASMKLLEMHEKMQGLKGGNSPDQGKGETHIHQQVVFSGTSAELAEMIKASRKSFKDGMNNIKMDIKADEKDLK